MIFPYLIEYLHLHKYKINIFTIQKYLQHIEMKFYVPCIIGFNFDPNYIIYTSTVNMKFI